MKIKHYLEWIAATMVVCISFTLMSCGGGGGGDNPPSNVSFVVNHDSLNYTKAAQTLTLSVQSPTTWTISGAADWCTVTATYNKIGDAGKVVNLNVSVTDNNSYDARLCKLIITAGSQTKTIVVTQSNEDGLILETPSYTAKAQGDTISVKLKSTANYNVTCNNPWIQQITTKTLTESTVQFAVGANITGASRTGTVTFTLGSITQTLTITQDAVSANIPADKTGMTSDAEPLVKKIYAGWNLGNALECPNSETAWGNPATTQAMIDMVKNAGFNAIRIPCAWSSHLSNASTYTIDPAWLSRVKQVVDYVVNDGMYAIINIHYDNGWLEDNVTTDKQTAVNAEQKALWTQIATYFRSYDEHLMFAGCNEPNVTDATGMSVLLTYEQTFIDAVRATGGRNYYRNLIIQGPATDIDKTNTLMTTLPTDVVSNRMIAEVHYYAPWQFCGMTADADWGNMFYFWGSYANQPDVDGVNRNATWGNEDYILTEFAKVKAQFVDKGIPVIAGEFGTIRRTMETSTEQTAHDNSIAEFVKDVTKDAKNVGIAPFVWDNGSFIFDRTDLTTRYPLFLQGMMDGAKAGTYPF